MTLCLCCFFAIYNFNITSVIKKMLKTGKAQLSHFDLEITNTKVKVTIQINKPCYW